MQRPEIKFCNDLWLFHDSPKFPTVEDRKEKEDIYNFFLFSQVNEQLMLKKNQESSILLIFLTSLRSYGALEARIFFFFVMSSRCLSK